MNGLKHILIACAVLLAAMPCCHSHQFELSDHGDTAETELCAAHTCSCHACDEIPCAEELEMPQELTLASAVVAAPPPAILLIVFSELKHAVRQVPPGVAGVLASIQTVQLLT
jgi:hypothetical protein